MVSGLIQLHRLASHVKQLPKIKQKGSRARRRNYLVVLQKLSKQKRLVEVIY